MKEFYEDKAIQTKDEDLCSQWDELHVQLKGLCIYESNNLKYSRLSKLPFKAINLLQSMTWRMSDIEESAKFLIEQNHILPAVILIRSAMENTAFLHVLFKEIKDNISNGELLESTDDLLMQMSYGNCYRKGEFITDEVFESLFYYKSLRSGDILKAIDERYPGYYSMYRALCEFVHNNGDGVEGSYMYIDEENHKTYFRRILTKESKLLEPFVGSLILALSIFIELFCRIEEIFPDFIKLCDEDIRKKLNMSTIAVEK